MNQENIEISIIVPLYNKKNSILKTIQSVLQQDFQNYELIVIDDGSTDGSADLLNHIHDNRLKIYKKRNTGVSDTRNMGIKQAQGKYIAFLDADDIWDTMYLKRLHQMIQEEPDCGMYAQNFKVIPIENLEDSLKENNEEKNIEKYTNWEKYFFNKTFRTSAIAVEKEKFVQCGGFDRSLSIGEDLEAWLRISLRYPVCYLNEFHVRIVFYSKEYHSRIVPAKIQEHYSYKLIKERAKYLQEKNNIYVQRLINKAIFYAYINFSWDKNRSAAQFLQKEIKIKLLSSKDKIKYLLFQIGILKYFVKR